MSGTNCTEMEEQEKQGRLIIKEHVNDIISIYFSQEGKKHPGYRGQQHAVNHTLGAVRVPSSV